MTQPQRVVPLVAEIATVAGHRIMALSVEVWDSWCVLRFARIDVGAERPLPRRVPPADAWSVSDDTGVDYHVVDAVGRGDRALSVGDVHLEPALSPDARTLTISVTALAGEPATTTTLDLS